MLNDASVVAEQREYQHMVGDVEKHAVGQNLHFAIAYGQPVLCPCGCKPGKCITSLSGGDVVQIKNVPKLIQEGYGLPNEILAKHNADWLHPGFRVLYNGILSDYVIDYDAFVRCDDCESVEIHVKEICD